MNFDVEELLDLLEDLQSLPNKDSVRIEKALSIVRPLVENANEIFTQDDLEEAEQKGYDEGFDLGYEDGYTDGQESSLENE